MTEPFIFYEWEGRVRKFYKEYGFPTLVNVGCCLELYRAPGCWATNKYAIVALIAVRQAYVDKFLSDSVELARNGQTIFYLTTDYGSLPILFEVNDALPQKVGATAICLHDSISIDYETEEKRNKAFDDVREQYDRFVRAVKESEFDRAALKKKHHQEWIELMTRSGY